MRETLGNEYVPRILLSSLLRTLSWAPVVLLTGPRQSGKTTLCKAIQTSADLPQKYEYFSFDDRGNRDFAKDDPVGFVDQLPPFAILDEVQLVPEIYRQLKVEVDTHRVPGRFLLTGSARLSLMSELSDSLAGRMQLVELFPFAQREIHQYLTSSDESSFLGTSENSNVASIVSQLFENRIIISERVQRPRLARELAQRIVEGGYPEPRQLLTLDRQKWYQNYVRTIASRDVYELTTARRIDIVPRLAEIAAAHTAQLFNITDVATTLDLSRNTVNDYVSILQNLFILQYLPAWSNNRLKRAVKAAKLHFLDAGFACALLNLDEASLWKDRKRFGQMTETFVVQELSKLTSWYDPNLSICHYRDRDRHEVDVVIEKSGSGIVAIEIKTGATVNDADFRGLEKLRKHSRNFVAGVVLYDGEWARTFGENLYALPISALWLDT
ncbi:MAG: ATP-binding protein [Gammaproteobacteria bacterium]|nr:ATP-binding protein [Gammaproteobacteria bacterium]MYF38180.1 ATP-binding protein [Gammaproteobacteria bacterium]